MFRSIIVPSIVVIFGSIFGFVGVLKQDVFIVVMAIIMTLAGWFLFINMRDTRRMYEVYYECLGRPTYGAAIKVGLVCATKYNIEKKAYKLVQHNSYSPTSVLFGQVIHRAFITFSDKNHSRYSHMMTDYR